jgi:hypothetical protein
MEYTLIQCPNCSNVLDVRIMDFYSGIGSSVVCCGRCDFSVQTGRKEWCHFTNRDKVRFFLVSLLEITILAILGGLVGGFIGHFLVQGPWQGKGSPINFGTFIGLPLSLFGGIGLQFHRVRTSIRRTSTTPPALIRTSWTDLETALQIKVCFFAILFGALGWLTSYLLWIFK